jgi:hypothetical protein
MSVFFLLRQRLSVRYNTDDMLIETTNPFTVNQRSDHHINVLIFQNISVRISAGCTGPNSPKTSKLSCKGNKPPNFYRMGRVLIRTSSLLEAEEAAWTLTAAENRDQLTHNIAKKRTEKYRQSA